MLEAGIVVVGILAFALIGYGCFSLLEEGHFSFPKDLKDGWFVLLFGSFTVAAFGVLFFLVRFVHWAWETPIPFLDRFTS